MVAELEAGTDLQILLGLPQLVGGGGGPGERGLAAGDGQDDHHQDQQQAQHRHADYHDLRQRGWNYHNVVVKDNSVKIISNDH